MSRSFVHNPIRAHIDELRACWGHEPRRERRLPVRSTLRFSVDTGATSASDVVMDGGSEALNQCVVRVFEQMTWPEPPCKVIVAYPILWVPEE